MKQTLITNARLLDPATNTDALGDILFTQTILDIGGRIDAPEAETIDAGGLCVMPGLIDMRVRIGEPGGEHKETFKSAGRAALAGGVTTLVQMPDTTPVIDDQSLVDFVLRRAPFRTPAKILPAAALTKGLDGEHLSEIGLLKEAGAVMFSNGDRAIPDTRVLRRALSYATAFGALVAHRPEDPFLAAGGVMHEGELAARLGLPGVAATAEHIYAERDLALAALTGSRLLLDLISSAGVLDPLRRAKAKNLSVYASVSANNLVLNENDVDGYRTFAKLSPPLRSEEDRRALCEALGEGLIDVIVSAHDPQPPEDKRLPFEEAAFGAVGLETLLPASLSLYHNGHAPLLAVLRALTQRPAEILGLPQGRLIIGAPADIIVVDIAAPFRVESTRLRSKAKNTSFDGKLMQGKVQRVFVDGAEIDLAASQVKGSL